MSGNNGIIAGAYSLRTLGVSERLSRREMEVLVGMANGYNNPEIGITLGLSHETVKSHSKVLFRKMGASSRTDAVVKAIISGVLLLPEQVDKAWV